ncbi:Na+/H+ antiporter NhaC family protein [Bowmanella pacifica]|uniref:Sodium:proton antiporter n=1 Tax=Bowmanella pacifica TaxID=502051 RepID=A0A918DGS5_9ALTE|nr:Na+/H+ antiporter NhaC family protein [Bowmanella pacifica]GGO65296.1 sodium:proton antiporter [Bowmanella pacifica]
MEQTMDWGIWSLIPLAVALIIAFTTKSAAFALLAGVVVGVVMLGTNPAQGTSQLFQTTLGNGDFIKITLIICLIGMLFSLLKRSGAIALFANRLARKGQSQRRTAVTTWGMGFFILDDYFSPLMTGAVMRPLTDKANIPREKLAFILDSTTASVCILVPFTAWAAYIVALIIAQGGPVESTAEAMDIYINAIPYNFYPILLVLFTLLICLKLLPDFGPMKKAEHRAKTTGALLREGATPLIDTEGEQIVSAPQGNASLLWHLLVPVLLLFGTAIISYVWVQKIYIVEAFMLAVSYLAISLFVTKHIQSIDQLVHICTEGIKAVIPAILIIALAYSINAVTKSLGAADYVIAVTSDFMTPGFLVALTFLITAFISFCTGTSWGSYALMIPIALPLAYSFSGNDVTPLVYQTVAAVAGGGIFGDHASPVSDTSVLSSAGAGSDHMDHVITQLPYALLIALLTSLLYLAI